MFLSKKYLISFFSFFKKIDNKKLEKMLNSVGIEVESIFKFEKTENLIVGEIKNVFKHPKSEKLNVCEVLFNNKINTIICGAQNVRKGLKVIVAQVGTKMLDGRLIESRDILGIKSNGMICAYPELTSRINFIDKYDLENIIELPNSAKVNDKDPTKYIGFDDDIFELSIPSNRNEFNGVLAIAYELFMIHNNKELPKWNIDLSELKEILNKKSRILSDEKDLVNFYGIIELDEIKSYKTSWEIKWVLINSGIKPTNTILDIASLLTIFTGSPITGYDKEKIGDDFTIKLNNKKEKFLSSGKVDYILDQKSAICIYSNDKIISLASLTNSFESSITIDTKNVIFEIANFNNLLIRKASDKLNIKTQNALVSSKKIPLWFTFKSFEIITNFLSQIGFRLKGVDYIYTPLLKSRKIPYKLETILNYLGSSIKQSDIKKNLIGMGFKVSTDNIEVPPYRDDIENINDIIEELLKKIDVNNLSLAPIENSSIDFSFNYFEDNKLFLESYFINKGFSLVKTLNLTSLENNEKFNLFDSKKHIKILNPISNIREYFRNNIIQQHLEVISTNDSHKNKRINIFEIQGLNYDDVWSQHLCLTLSTSHFFNKINNSKINIDLLFIKSILTDLSSIFELDLEIKKITDCKYNKNIIIKNNSLAIFNKDKLIGYASQVNPELLDTIGINNSEPIYFLEIVIDNLLNTKTTKIIKTKPEKTHHSIDRQITITVLNEESFFKYKKVFDEYKNIKELINEYSIESVFFKGDKISYTFSFEINQLKLPELKVEKINEILESLIKDFEKIGAEIIR